MSKGDAFQARATRASHGAAARLHHSAGIAIAETLTADQEQRWSHLIQFAESQREAQLSNKRCAQFNGD